MNPWATPVILPALLHQVKTAGKWQVKTGCLATIDQMVVAAPDQMGKAMPIMVPFLADAVWDTKSDVKKAAKATLTKATALVSNKDIEKFIPALIKALLNPVEEVPKTIQLLSATTFVSEVDAPTLSLMAPLLSRGLDERPTAVKRKVAVITDNMAKLVDNEYTVRPFIPKLLPGLIKISETIADPEARGVVNRAIKTLREVAKIPEGDGTDLPPPKIAEGPHLSTNLIGEFIKQKTAVVPDSDNRAIQYAGVLQPAWSTRTTTISPRGSPPSPTTSSSPLRASTTYPSSVSSSRRRQARRVRTTECSRTRRKERTCVTVPFPSPTVPRSSSTWPPSVSSVVTDTVSVVVTVPESRPS